MCTEDKELINLIIQSRLCYYYTRRKRYSPEKLAARDNLEDEFEALLKSLPEEQANLIRRHEDQILSECGDENILYYRGGLKDGLRLKYFIQKMVGSKSKFCSRANER